LSDMRRTALGGRRMGLPLESALRAGCVGGVDADETVRASMNGAPRVVGTSWERWCMSMSVAEECVESGWVASEGPLVDSV
jgi:hypothetical protein